MKKSIGLLILLLVSVVMLVVGVGIGSVWISPADTIGILLHKLFGANLPQNITAKSVGIIWSLRLPRALLAFLVGAALSLSGAVMQSVLQNPLASSYTMGVSAGAGLGVALVISAGLTIPFLGFLTQPAAGLICGVLAVIAAVSFASKVDKSMGNSTIVLTGMIFSLFIDAIISTISSFSREDSQKIMEWSRGSFALRGTAALGVLAPVLLLCFALMMSRSQELDIMTFGEEQAKSLGVELKREKWLMLTVASALTGTAITFVGIIGFVDLIAPHIVRKIFGASHKYVLPASALLGGTFMILADLLARTIASPSEIPVGAVSALIGAPFFGYVYFKNRRREQAC